MITSLDPTWLQLTPHGCVLFLPWQVYGCGVSEGLGEVRMRRKGDPASLCLDGMWYAYGYLEKLG